MKPETTVKTANKHEIKTRETRALLLKAAETIFVRDGYEGAELGEIAALAGRTKGAIYAQFKSKEDMFLALIEQYMLSYRAEMSELLAKSTSVAENMVALRKFTLDLAKHEVWALLMLEFKLFAIRHPESKERLKSFNARMLYDDPEATLSRILGPAGKGKNAISRTLAAFTLRPMLSALLLEAKFDPDLFGEDAIRKVFAKVFDAVLDTSSE